jgi:hypothetical protein
MNGIQTGLLMLISVAGQEQLIERIGALAPARLMESADRVFAFSPLWGPALWFCVCAGSMLVLNEYVFKKPYSKLWPLFLSALLLVFIATHLLDSPLR